MARKTFKVKDILPNPFRHIESYPIKKEKVDALIESIESTGFWDNIVARPANAKAEIAYGHHRLAALKEVFKPSHEVSLEVRDLDDAAMLKIMARENMEEWDRSVVVEHETIRSVVEAYADGLIDLPKPSPRTSDSQLRFAPSYIPGSSARGGEDHPYTAQTVAEFIGWLKPSGEAQAKVSDALNALALIEQGVLKEKDFDNLTTKQAQAVVQEARRVLERREAQARKHREAAERAEREAQAAAERRKAADRERKKREAEAAKARDEEERRRARADAARLKRERADAEKREREAERQRQAAEKKERAARDDAKKKAKSVGQAVSRKIKSGEIGTREARRVSAEIDKPKKGERVVWAENVARSVATKLNRMLDPDRDARAKEVVELVRLRDMLDEDSREEVAKNLEIVARRAQDYADQIRGKKN